MSDLVFVCARGKSAGVAISEAVRTAALRLAPATNAGRAPREPRLVQGAGALAAIVQPPERGGWAGKAADGGGACDGVLRRGAPSWDRPGGPVPDGSYALVRWDRDRVELLTDVCAGRTLWYAATDDCFLASTSQRAIVMLQGSFNLHPPAVAWLLSSGTLGPDASWDGRIQRVTPDTRLVLDRASWRLTEHAAPFVLAPAPGSLEHHTARLREAVLTTLTTLDIDPDRWMLPLSGGQDSRLLLGTLVAAGMRPRCLTWTTRASLRNPLSDVSIARRLTRHFGVEHELWCLDDARTSLPEALDRFVAGNEGRNDAFVGYVDGLELWAHLRDAGIEGIIRGDESCGWRLRLPTAENGRRQVGGTMADDYPDGHVIRRLGLAPQTWPRRLRMGDDETPEGYRVRLGQQGWLPIIAAGLTEPKARFVQVVNPLLSRLVVTAVRELPEDYRKYARAFTDLSHAQAPTIPFSRFASTPPFSGLLATPESLSVAVAELLSPRMARVLSSDAITLLLAAMVSEAAARPAAKARLKSVLKSVSLPLPLRHACRMAPAWKGPDPLPAARLAFRAALASKTVTLLERDAEAIATPLKVGRVPG